MKFGDVVKFRDVLKFGDITKFRDVLKFGDVVNFGDVVTFDDAGENRPRTAHRRLGIQWLHGSRPALLRDLPRLGRRPACLALCL